MFQDRAFEIILHDRGLKHLYSLQNKITLCAVGSWAEAMAEIVEPNKEISFAVKDGEDLYSQQKQDRELTVPQIVNSLLPNSDLN